MKQTKLHIYTFLKGPWLFMRMDDFNGGTVCVLATIKAVRLQRPNGGQNYIFTFHICVPLNDEYWFDGLCSAACAVSVIINPLGAITIILLSYSPVTSCRGHFWMSRGNNWDNYSQMQGENTQHMHYAAYVWSYCENLLCCSVHHMISYDLLIVLLVMRNAIAFYCFT